MYCAAHAAALCFDYACSEQPASVIRLLGGARLDTARASDWCVSSVSSRYECLHQTIGVLD